MRNRLSPLPTAMFHKPLLLAGMLFTIFWNLSLLPANGEEFFQVERLVVAGKDVTPQKGFLDLEAPAEGASTATIELAFALHDAKSVDIAKLRISCDTVMIGGWGNRQQNLIWDENSSFDATTGKGTFRVPRFNIHRHHSYSFSVDASQIASNAPKASPYQFTILTYPSIPNVGMNALPFYVIEGQHKWNMLGFENDIYTEMNRLVPPNTSLHFSFTPAKEFWPGKEPIEPHLRIFLVELDVKTEEEAFRQLHARADMPSGRETILYDALASKTLDGFTVQVIDTGKSSSIFAPVQNYLGEQRIWIRKLAKDKPPYQNTDYLKPGAYYSLQFELAHGPYEGIRYEASRFGVRPEMPKSAANPSVEIRADYSARNFVDWQGDWFNGHLYPTNNIPSAHWGQDFLLMKEARDKHPDLWRTFHYQYLSEDFSSMFNFLANIYRDRSTRNVTEAKQDENGDIVVALKHILGAEHFHDLDNTSDTLASHPVVADEKESIYSPGDLVFLQTHKQILQAKVKEVRRESNEVVLETTGTLWAVKPEGASRAYPAILGDPGSAEASISLPGNYSGTYLRQRNGKPYANWGILNFTFDFVINAMEMRASIERYGPYQFVGDAFTGQPTREGWQIVSDCEYYMMRHMLRRYPNKPLDTILHPIFGESNGYQHGGDRYIQLYDFYADGILRAYEQVMGVLGEEYKKIRIGMGGVMLPWGLEWMIRHTVSHVLPAPLEVIFPADAPAIGPGKSFPNMPLGSNPLYYFTGSPVSAERSDQSRYRAGKWDTNGCFLDASGNSILNPDAWDENGRLTTATVERLLPNWRNSRWLLENTRYGKGTPFRSVNVEGYGWSAEDLAKAVLFEKELLAKLDRNLKAAAKDDPYVANYLQGIYCGTIQDALFNWAVTGSQAVGRPFQGTGYWPTYFADAMRRILAYSAEQERGIFNVGTFTFDSYLGPDGGNIGTPADTVSFPKQAIDWMGTRPTKMVDLGNGHSLEVDTANEVFEKDIRKLIRFIGMMTHRLAALPEQNINGHVISGVASKEWTSAPADVVSGNEAGDDKRFYVLLYDHYVPDIESQDQTEIPVRLRIQNLPEGADSAIVTVYRLDKEHGSVFPVTESEEFRKIQESQAKVVPTEILEALRKTAGLHLDEQVESNGGSQKVSGGALDLDVVLAANRTLFAVVDWNESAD